MKEGDQDQCHSKLPNLEGISVKSLQSESRGGRANFINQGGDSKSLHGSNAKTLIHHKRKYNQTTGHRREENAIQGKNATDHLKFLLKDMQSHPQDINQHHHMNMKKSNVNGSSIFPVNVPLQAKETSITSMLQNKQKGILAQPVNATTSLFPQKMGKHGFNLFQTST